MNNKQFKKYYRITILFKILVYISLLLPLIVYMSFNFNSYFLKATGWKVSMGFLISLVVAILFIKKETKFLKGLVGYIVAFLIVYLLTPIIKDLQYLLLCLLVGKVISLPFGYVYNQRNFVVQEYKKAKIHSTVWKSQDKGENLNNG